MLKKVLVVMLLTVCACAYAADVEVWHDDSLKVSELKKILVMPVESSLSAGSQLMPAKKLNAQLEAWAVEGVSSAFKKGRVTVKTRDALLEDMKFIYSDNVTEGELFFKRAAEMGYKAFVRAAVSQEFKTEHIPESTRTYTEYKEIEKRDAKGRVIEVLRIPEEKTEVTPAHDVTYLYTVCEPRIYFTDDYSGDHVGAVNYKIYREYMGGAVMKVVENILKGSMKTLFTQR